MRKDLAKQEADKIGRQEVTAEWYLENMLSYPLFVWLSDEDYKYGLDPWRLIDGPFKNSKKRYFVQKDEYLATLLRI